MELQAMLLLLAMTQDGRLTATPAGFYPEPVCREQQEILQEHVDRQAREGTREQYYCMVVSPRDVELRQDGRVSR